MTPVESALIMGRLAAGVLEALPLNGRSYSDDEIAAQYAAVDRLVAAFRQLDAAVIRREPHIAWTNPLTDMD